MQVFLPFFKASTKCTNSLVSASSFTWYHNMTGPFASDVYIIFWDSQKLHFSVREIQTILLVGSPASFLGLCCAAGYFSPHPLPPLLSCCSFDAVIPVCIPCHTHSSAPLQVTGKNNTDGILTESDDIVCR